jgi:CRP-like cAMP-binding protein
MALPIPDPVLDPHQNRLLGALSSEERERIYPHLQLVPLPLGKVLYESGDLLRYVYFPTDSIVSLLYVLADGASAEISVVGNEGLIGIALFMGGETTPSRAIVQSAGQAYRLLGDRLKEEFHRNGSMQLLLLRYTQDGWSRAAQAARSRRGPGRNPRVHCYRTAAVGSLMITSTRRFCCRPAAESFPATGSLSPLPDALRRVASIPCPVKYDFTESARRCDSPWL